MKKILGLFVLLSIQSCGFTVVETGHIGVKTSMGKVIESGLSEGVHFHTPFTTSIHDVDTRLQSVSIETMAYTKDVQQASISVTVNYSLNGNEAEHIFRNGNKSYAEKVLAPRVLSKLKEVVGKYEAESLVANRDKVEEVINNELKEVLNGDHINLRKINLGNFDFSDVFERAIEAKQVATQRAKEAQNKTVEIEEQKKQTILSAQAEAEAMKIKTQALKENKGLTEYEAVQKWDGKLPQYMMGNSVPFININK